MNRSASYRRQKTEEKINRRLYIARHIMKWGENNTLLANGVHRFDKGKVHCSCPMCSTKELLNGKKHSLKKRLNKYDLTDF